MCETDEESIIVVIKNVPSAIIKGFCYNAYILGEELDGAISGNREFNTFEEAKEWVDKHITYDVIINDNDVDGEHNIKKCPFCGKPGQLIEHPYEWGYYDPSYDVGCIDKKCRGYIHKTKYSLTASKTREEAIKKWNKRYN